MRYPITPAPIELIYKYVSKSTLAKFTLLYVIGVLK